MYTQQMTVFRPPTAKFDSPGAVGYDPDMVILCARSYVVAALLARRLAVNPAGLLLVGARRAALIL